MSRFVLLPRETTGFLGVFREKGLCVFRVGFHGFRLVAALGGVVEVQEKESVSIHWICAGKLESYVH